MTVDASYPSYVLVTAARNEAAHIERTIRSVLAQTVPPLRWVIVSDNSSDGTDAIIQRHAATTSWIQYLRMEGNEQRNFASKARTIALAREQVRGLPYEIIANIDADVEFNEDYIAHLLQQFSRNPNLGVAGTPYDEFDYTSHRHKAANFKDVPGSCQFFRRQCFDQIGGYRALAHGGIDTFAVMQARMNGWVTEVFPRHRFLHLKPMGTGDRGLIGALIEQGRRDYRFGNQIIWEVCRAGRQMFRPPYLARGIFILFGFFSLALTRAERSISKEMLAFRRREQIERLCAWFHIFRHSKAASESAGETLG